MLLLECACCVFHALSLVQSNIEKPHMDSIGRRWNSQLNKTANMKIPRNSHLSRREIFSFFLSVYNSFRDLSSTRGRLGDVLSVYKSLTIKSDNVPSASLLRCKIHTDSFTEDREREGETERGRDGEIEHSSEGLGVATPLTLPYSFTQLHLFTTIKAFYCRCCIMYFIVDALTPSSCMYS